MFSEENINAQYKLRSHTNFMTGIDDNTLKESIHTLNFVGIGLCAVNDIFFDKKSDGLVTISSQRKIESFIPSIKPIQLDSAHHVVTSIDRIMNIILSFISDKIDEQEESRKHQKKFGTIIQK